MVSFEIDNRNTYENAKSVCENICGRLYFPSTLKENDEVNSVLNRECLNRRTCRNRSVWLRLTYDETISSSTWYNHMVGWYDPDNKEDLTFLNFDHFDRIREYAGTMEHHVIMDTEEDGKWWSRAGIQKHSPCVVCEPT